MKIVYYPSMFINNDNLLKTLLLFWGKVETIIPKSQHDYINSYLKGEIKGETHYPLEIYKKIYDQAGEEIVDFLIISKKEREHASDSMFQLLTKWDKDTKFFDSLRIKSIEDFIGKEVEYFWFLNEKIERPLVELMMEENLAVNWAEGEIVGFEQVGKSYMSIVAEEIKKARNCNLVTNDDFYVAAKSGINLKKVENEDSLENSHELVSLAIPQIFIDPAKVAQLSWEEVIAIRDDLLPLSESYFGEIDKYQNEINKLSLAGNSEKAFDKLAEFCERVAASFKPFAKETGKLLRLAGDSKKLTFLNGVILPTLKILNPDPVLDDNIDIVAVSSTLGHYELSKGKVPHSFEYLENLNRKLTLSNYKNRITSLVPKIFQ